MIMTLNYNVETDNFKLNLAKLHRNDATNYLYKNIYTFCLTFQSLRAATMLVKIYTGNL